MLRHGDKHGLEPTSREHCRGILHCPESVILRLRYWNEGNSNAQGTKRVDLSEERQEAEQRKAAWHA